jgi:hypothetical protein
MHLVRIAVLALTAALAASVAQTGTTESEASDEKTVAEREAQAQLRTDLI